MKKKPINATSVEPAGEHPFGIAGMVGRAILPLFEAECLEFLVEISPRMLLLRLERHDNQIEIVITDALM